ncbi:MAG: hypothetical protein Q8P86_00590 [bacterium]|nr:hypothetical protein [bacterium]
MELFTERERREIERILKEDQEGVRREVKRQEILAKIGLFGRVLINVLFVMTVCSIFLVAILSLLKVISILLR